LDEEGEIRQKGEMVRGRAGCWEYFTAAAGKVLVEAWDLAGNKTSREI